MDEFKNALLELAKAIERNDAVRGVKVTITLNAPKPNRATEQPNGDR